MLSITTPQTLHSEWNIILLIASCLLPQIVTRCAYRYVSNNGMLSKTYRTTPSSKKNLISSTVDSIIILLSKSATTLILISYISFLLLICFLSTPGGAKYFDNINQHYINITGNIPSAVLSVLLGVIGVSSISTAANRADRAFISTRDVLANNKFQERILDAVIYYLWFVILHGVDYWMTTCREPTMNTHLFSFFLQGCAVLYLLLSVSHALILLYKILKIFLAEGSRLLNDQYKQVHNNFRNPNEFLNKSNYYSIDASISHLCTPLYLNKGENIHKSFDKQRIESFFTLDIFDDMPKPIRRYTMGCIFCMCGIIITPIYFPISYSLLRNSLSVSLIGCGTCILINVLMTVAVFRKKGNIRNFYIRAAIGSWGFYVTAPDGTRYFSEYERYGVGKNSGKQEQKVLHQIYCVVATFRDTLATEAEIAKHFLEQVEKHVKQADCGYLLLVICLHLFCRAYPEHKIRILEKFKETISAGNVDTAVLAHNATEITKSILRTEESRECDCHYLFSSCSQPQKSEYDTKWCASTSNGYRSFIKTRKKSNYKLLLHLMFVSDKDR